MTKGETTIEIASLLFAQAIVALCKAIATEEVGKLRAEFQVKARPGPAATERNPYAPPRFKHAGTLPRYLPDQPPVWVKAAHKLQAGGGYA